MQQISVEIFNLVEVDVLKLWLCMEYSRVTNNRMCGVVCVCGVCVCVCVRAWVRAGLGGNNRELEFFPCIINRGD